MTRDCSGCGSVFEPDEEWYHRCPDCQDEYYTTSYDVIEYDAYEADPDYDNDIDCNGMGFY